VRHVNSKFVLAPDRTLVDFGEEPIELPRVPTVYPNALLLHAKNMIGARHL